MLLSDPSEIFVKDDSGRFVGRIDREKVARLMKDDER